MLAMTRDWIIALLLVLALIAGGMTYAIRNQASDYGCAVDQGCEPSYGEIYDQPSYLP